MLLSCAACENKKIDKEKVTKTEAAEVTVDQVSVSVKDKTPEIKTTKITKKDDFVKLTIKYPEEIKRGETFVLTASIKNTTDKDITYRIPTMTPDMHKEIKIVFPKGGSHFTDLDTVGKASDDAFETRYLRIGETFTEKINFCPIILS